MSVEKNVGPHETALEVNQDAIDNASNDDIREALEEDREDIEAGQ